MHGLILFAHGARDPRWAEPLFRLRDRVAAACAGTPVDIAYLEIMTPDLPTTATRMIGAGCTELTIVPVFLGQGGHVRRDLAALVTAVTDANPGIAIRTVAAVGEDDAVLDALARYCVAALGNRGGGTQNTEGRHT